MFEVPLRSNAVVVYVLRDTPRGVELLLLRRSKGEALDDLWCHVAGKIEAGEKAWQAALRELREETGLVPREFFSANYCEQFYSAKDDVICLLPVFVAWVSSGDTVSINDEHSAYRWFTIDEAYAAVSMDNQRRCLDMIARSFIDAAPHSFSRIEGWKE